MKTLKNVFPYGAYVLLDLETGEPAEYNGMYALQSGGHVIADGMTLEHAQLISEAINFEILNP